MGGGLFKVSFDKGVSWPSGDGGRTRAHGNWVTREALVPLKGSAVTQLLQIVARQNAGPTSAELLVFQEERNQDFCIKSKFGMSATDSKLSSA